MVVPESINESSVLFRFLQHERKKSREEGRMFVQQCVVSSLSV